jgi:hypothetical protein
MSALPAIDRTAINRAAINQENAQHSTGPRTPEGKARSSQNALRHGLTSRGAVLPCEDQSAYQQHCRQFFDEYQPATPTETQLTHELADTAWRLNRVPALEADLLRHAGRNIDSDMTELHRTLATLSLHGARLSRQFQKTLQQIRELQAERLSRRSDDLKQAAALLELHKQKGLSYDPAQDGFVFSGDEIEAHSQHLMRQNEAHHIAHSRFECDPRLAAASAS